MFKIIAAVAVATTVQTASAAKSNDLVFRDCVPAPGETADPDCESWPTPHTIKLANPDYNATDPDSIRFVDEPVDLGPDRFKAAKCKSTTGFDYVGPSLIQQGLAAAVEDAEVEENEFQIFNTYGAGINYCRYTCQETQGCLYYTLANNRCNLKGEGTVLKQLKAGKTTQGGACTPRVPDADLPTVAPTPAPTPAPTGVLDTCEAHSIYEVDEYDDLILVDVNIELRKQCRTFKADPTSADFDCLFTKKRRRANGEPGGCYTKPEPINWDDDGEPYAVPTPSPRHCRKQCANKFDRLKRGKGKSSYEHVCGLKNCKDCVECTVPPMVNYTVPVSWIEEYSAGVWLGACPRGCKAPANATTGDLCYDQSATIKEIAAETNLCTPLFYGDRDEYLDDGTSRPTQAQWWHSQTSCPTGCVSHGVVRPADSSGNARYAKVCIRDESFSTEDMKEDPESYSNSPVRSLNVIDELCIGPVEKHRMCIFVDPDDAGVDFKTKVIARITQKGFWETHCQEECYQNKECGAFVYTRGTCKLFETVDEAPDDEYSEYRDLYFSNDDGYAVYKDVMHLKQNVKILRNANPKVTRWAGVCVHPRLGILLKMGIEYYNGDDYYYN